MSTAKSETGSSFALFEAGWRPFFPAAGLMATAAIPAWLAAFLGHLPLSVAWHAHEMVFGFVAAAVAGFLLTAVPNWTGRERLHGLPLAALFGLWCAGRIAVLAGEAPLVDLAFLPILAAIALHAVIAARNRRNYGIVAAVLLLAACNGVYHFHDWYMGVQAAIWLLVILVTVIGGRITPAFTQNALRQGGRPDVVCATPLWLDRTTIGLIAVAGVAQVFLPGSTVSGTAAGLAAVAAAARMAGWHSLETWRSPIVWILHVGMAWIPVGLLLQALADFGTGVPQTAAVHAFTAGLFGTMILAVATRAALGHSGRPLVASPATVAAYVLVVVGAVLRVATLDPDLIVVSGIAWSLGYAVFTVAYARIMVVPRADGRPG